MTEMTAKSTAQRTWERKRKGEIGHADFSLSDREGYGYAEMGRVTPNKCFCCFCEEKKVSSFLKDTYEVVYYSVKVRERMINAGKTLVWPNNRMSTGRVVTMPTPEYTDSCLLFFPLLDETLCLNAIQSASTQEEEISISPWSCFILNCTSR